VHALNLFLKFLYVVKADQVLWNSTENHLFPPYFSWSLSHFYLLNPTSHIPCPIFPHINPIASFLSSPDRSTLQHSSYILSRQLSQFRTQNYHLSTHVKITRSVTDRKHIQNHKAFPATGACVYVLHRAKRNSRASSLRNATVWFKNIKWKYCTKHVLGSLVLETRRHSQTAISVIWSNHEHFLVTAAFRSWLVPFQGARHLLTLATTGFTAAWLLPTTSPVVLRRITRTWAFTFPYRKKKNSSAVDPTNKEAMQLALHVQSTFPVYVVLNHRRKCSPQCAASPWIWNHVRLTARGTSSTATVEQFLEITIT
jgi:hypothetical protein